MKPSASAQDDWHGLKLILYSTAFVRTPDSQSCCGGWGSRHRPVLGSFPRSRGLILSEVSPFSHPVATSCLPGGLNHDAISFFRADRPDKNQQPAPKAHLESPNNPVMRDPIRRRK